MFQKCSFLFKGRAQTTDQCPRRVCRQFNYFPRLMSYTVSRTFKNIYWVSKIDLKLFSWSTRLQIWLPIFTTGRRLVDDWSATGRENWNQISVEWISLIQMSYRVSRVFKYIYWVSRIDLNFFSWSTRLQIWFPIFTTGRRLVVDWSATGRWKLKARFEASWTIKKIWYRFYLQ